MTVTGSTASSVRAMASGQAGAAARLTTARPATAPSAPRPSL
jgi:hypothetical protein